MSQTKKPTLFPIITKRKWRKLAHALQSRHAVEYISERDDSNLSCLSLALGYQAPLEIINMMIEVDPQLAFRKDAFGATALHVACLNGASPNLVDLLLKRHDEIAYEVDLDKRGALHHAVEYACDREVIHHEDYTHDTYVDVIQNLCNAAPDMLYCYDNTGETPIDLVQRIKRKNEKSGPMYEKLQLIYLELTAQSVKLYRENRRRWELEGYMTKLCIDQVSETCTRTTVSSHSTILTPNSEGRILNLDAESIQETEYNDSKERIKDLLDTIVE